MKRVAFLLVAAPLVLGCRDEPDRQVVLTEPTLSVAPADTAISSVCRAYLRELQEAKTLEQESAPAATDGEAVTSVRQPGSGPGLQPTVAHRQSLKLRVANLHEVMSDACR